ncbi:zinc ribbon domain-containing protein [Deinococcus sp. VB343]|uniref:zinc ribbon domain-containing protein n=1 Tax=Deinococcus sp. VB343 TaxID=3385567 RepID=UPI0039C8FC1E
MFVTYNMPIFRSSSQVLARMLAAEAIEPVAETYSGCEGTIYALVNPDDLRWHDEFAIRLQGQQCQVNLYALPTAEYLALIQAQNEIRAFDLGSLLTALADPLSNSKTIGQQLLDVVRSDKAAVNTVPYVSTYSSVWLSHRTRFCRSEKGWLLILAFETISGCRPSMGSKAGFGLDVGLSPVVTAVNTRGDVSRIKAPPAIPINDLLSQARNPRENHLIQRIAHEAQHALVRNQLEELIENLVQFATVVVVEDLDLVGFQRSARRIDRQLRDLGMIDFLKAWLPQRLGEFGIPLYREPAAYTSQLCSQCVTRNGRSRGSGEPFVCTHCGYRDDPHVNAATILARTGIGQVLRDLQAQLRPFSRRIEAADD